MICLTGDVHHMSLNTQDQKYLSATEVDTALEYATTTNKHGIKATLFLTGKTIEEEPKKVKKFSEFNNIEIGGHTYYAFKPKWFYNWFSNRLLGLSNGPKIYQNYEIKKTVNIFFKDLAINIVSWRNHAYRKDKNTDELLKKNGIKYVSDDVNPDMLNPFENKSGLISVPINVMPDHDHIYHAKLTPETTKNYSLKRDKFPSKLYYIDEWLSIIKGQIDKIIAQKGIVTILAHPACMKIADDFKTFKELCKFLSEYETIFMKNTNEFVQKDNHG